MTHVPAAETALRRARSWAGLALASALSLGSATAVAQDVGAADLQTASAAFAEGQRAQLRGDYAQAAELFDLANRSAPSAAAIRSAIRMHHAAGHETRAATLAAEARELYATDASTVALADELLATLRPTLARVIVTCTPSCALALDGRAVTTEPGDEVAFFVEPGARVLVASWGPLSVREALTATAGGELRVSLAEPERPPVEEPPPPVVDAPLPIVAPAVPVDRGEGLSPAFTAIAGGLTGVAVGLTVASGVDMLAARDAYVGAPSEAGWRDGVGRETRTNVLLGTSVALAAATVVLAFVTDWGGGPTPTVAVGTDGAFAGLSGHF